MKLSSDFLMLFIVKVSLCKSHLKYTYDSKSLEGDILIDKILSSDKFHKLADKIVDKAIEKINTQQSGAANPAVNVPEIGTKKSNVNPNPEFKSIQNKDAKPVKKNKKAQKRYKPGKINIEAVMQKKIRPSDDLTFRYNRFTKSDKITTVSDKQLPKQDNVEKTKDLNVVNENDESTTKHRVIKKPSAKDNSEDENNSGTGTDEECKSEENKNPEKTTLNDFSVESTKFADSDVTQATKLQNDDNPFGNEKVIIWNGRHTDNEGNDDSEDKSEVKNGEKTNPQDTQVTAKITEGKTNSMKNIPHLFRAETVPSTTPKDTRVNEVDDDNDDDADDDNEDHGDDQEDTKTQLAEIKNRNKQIIRREGDRTYVLKDSSDYQEYHEQLAKMRKTQT